MRKTMSVLMLSEKSCYFINPNAAREIINLVHFKALSKQCFTARLASRLKAHFSHQQHDARG